MKAKRAKRIARGMRWLDKYYPGWQNRVRLSTLDMAVAMEGTSSAACLLQQIIPGGYESAYRAYGHDWCVRHGFTLKRGKSEIVWENFTAQWTIAIIEHPRFKP